LAQLVELNSVTQVQVGPGRIEALLDAQGTAALQLRDELCLHQQFIGAAQEDRELFLDVGRHRRRLLQFALRKRRPEQK